MGLGGDQVFLAGLADGPPCATSTSVRTVIFWDPINGASGFGTELIRYQTACPMNTPVRTVFFQDFILRWTRGGEGGTEWAAKTVKRPHNNQHSPRCANYLAPLTRKRNHIEHRPQRPTERSDPTQHTKGRTGDCPGPRRRNCNPAECHTEGGGWGWGQEGVRDMGTQERHQTGGGATQTHRTREPHQEGQGRAQQARRRGTARQERQPEQREQGTRMERMAERAHGRQRQ